MTNISNGNGKKQKYIALFLGDSSTHIHINTDTVIEKDDLIVLGFPQGNTIREVLHNFKAHLRDNYNPADIPTLIQDTVLYPIGGEAVYLHSYYNEQLEQLTDELLNKEFSSIKKLLLNAPENENTVAKYREQFAQIVLEMDSRNLLLDK